MIHDLQQFVYSTGLFQLQWQMLVMWLVCGLLFYLAIYRGFEPLLLVPIAFGALIANLPTHGILTTIERDGYVETAVFTVQSEPMFHGTGPSSAPHAVGSDDLTVPGAQSQAEVGAAVPGTQSSRIVRVEGGLFDFISQGIKLELFPPLIFLGVGALTDFGPLIANPRTLLLGAAAQLGVLFTFVCSIAFGFSTGQAAAIGIIGGADGPTAIFLSNKLAPELLGAIAVAAYSYMALVPLIQPPIMRLLTTRKERTIRMQSLRKVSKLEKLVFAMLVTITCILIVPDASPLIAMLMLGNFLRECGVTQRLVGAAQNEIINVVTIFLGVSVGLTMGGKYFLRPETLKIIALGVVAFGVATASGVLMAKLMNLLSPRNPINPLIGSAGVSAVPMAARVSHVEGQRADPHNHLLMHAMGPNVAGVIGTAVIAGYFISTLAR
jgi:carboxybiotin decarboxylase